LSKETTADSQFLKISDSCLLAAHNKATNILITVTAEATQTTQAPQVDTTTTTSTTTT